MGVSSEASARAVIQRLRPSAKKHGLSRAILDAYLREHLPDGYRSGSREEMKRAPNYNEIRNDGEYRRPHFNPDLSEVYPEDREIIIFEIQDRCPISRLKLQEIWRWIGVLDGWAEWNLLLITTNGLGFGWHVMIDTLADGREYALNSFRSDASNWVRTYPHENSEDAIKDIYYWRNWKMPLPEEFEALRQAMSFL